MTPQERERALWSAAGAALFIAYALTWWTSYCPPNSGNELFVMNAASHGQMPYRDYYWVQPPGIPLMFIVSQRLFGTALFPFFAFSLLFRGLAAFALGLTLSQRRNPVVAGLVSGAAMIVSCNDDGEVIDHYLHWTSTCAVFLLAGAYPWVVGRSSAWLPLRAHAVIAGVAAGMLIVIKQTNVIFVFLVFAFLVIVATLDGRRREDIKRLLAIGVLCAIAPIGLTLTWVARLGAFRPFLDDCYLVGPRSKGNPATVFLRFFTAPFQFSALGQSASLALALVVAIVAFLALRRAAAARTDSALGGLGLVFLGGALLVAYWASAVSDAVWLVSFVRSSIYAGIFGCIALTVESAWRYGRARGDDDALHCLFLAFSSFALAYSMSGSWGAMEFMSFPTLAVALSELFERCDTVPGGPEVRAAVAIVAILWVATSARWRYKSPYRWSYWFEPEVSRAEYRSRQPALWGFTMSHGTAMFIDSVTDMVKVATNSDEPVLVFPHLLLVPALADRRTLGFAPMLFFDVCTDACARGEAERLVSTPPPVVVYQDYSDGVLAAQEGIWRDGRPSGQRELLDAMRSLTRSRRFTDVRDFTENGLPVRVLVRSDRLQRLRDAGFDYSSLAPAGQAP